MKGSPAEPNRIYASQLKAGGATVGWASAIDAFGGFLRELALVGVWLAVFSPLWLPFALWITWLFVRSARRARGREVVTEPPAQA